MSAKTDEFLGKFQRGSYAYDQATNYLENWMFSERSYCEALGGPNFAILGTIVLGPLYSQFLQCFTTSIRARTVAHPSSSW